MIEGKKLFLFAVHLCALVAYVDIRADDNIAPFNKIDCKKFVPEELNGRLIPRVSMLAAKDFKQKYGVEYLGGELLADDKHAIETWKVCGKLIYFLTRNENESNERVAAVLYPDLKSKHVYAIVSARPTACKRGKDDVYNALAFVDSSQVTEWLPALKVFEIDLKLEVIKEVSAKEVKCLNESYGAD